MNEWKIQGSRVYGQGQSYNCTNIVNAQTLHKTLNTYETKINELQQYKEIRNNIQKIKQQITALQMDITVVTEDINKIKELLE